MRSYQFGKLSGRRRAGWRSLARFAVRRSSANFRFVATAAIATDSLCWPTWPPFSCPDDTCTLLPVSQRRTAPHVRQGPEAHRGAGPDWPFARRWWLDKKHPPRKEAGTVDNRQVNRGAVCQTGPFPLYVELLSGNQVILFPCRGSLIRLVAHTERRSVLDRLSNSILFV